MAIVGTPTRVGTRKLAGAGIVGSIGGPLAVLNKDLTVITGGSAAASIVVGGSEGVRDGDVTNGEHVIPLVLDRITYRYLDLYVAITGDTSEGITTPPQVRIFGKVPPPPSDGSNNDSTLNPAMPHNFDSTNFLNFQNSLWIPLMEAPTGSALITMSDSIGARFEADSETTKLLSLSEPKYVFLQGCQEIIATVSVAGVTTSANDMMLLGRPTN